MVFPPLLGEGKSLGYSPGVFVFPFYFHPSRLHIVACPDIKDCEKMILPIFGKTFYFSSILGAR
jgi:hypothetical protein